MQVSEESLFWLADNLNNTRHAYTTRAPDSDAPPAAATAAAAAAAPVTRTYLLDVNPHATSRVYGDGFNIIDARWISVADGLYIDITALSETEPEEQPGILSCKNFHHYRRRHLWPLRETRFEGVRARVPFAYRTVLADEYATEAMVRTEWEGYRWSAARAAWERMPPEEARRYRERREREREEKERREREREEKERREREEQERREREEQERREREEEDQKSRRNEERVAVEFGSA